MRKISLYFMIPILLFSIHGCTHSRDTAPTPAPRQRISLEDAQVLIDELSPDRELKIQEITSDTLWAEMRVQLFVNVSAEQYEYVFAIAGDMALMLKEFWGSYYFDYVLADMDGDGQREMLYVYDWGSGIVRSVMGILKPDGSIAAIVPTENAKGIWFIHTLKTENDAVTCDVTPATGEGPAQKGICTYKNDEYIFDIER